MTDQMNRTEQQQGSNAPCLQRARRLEPLHGDGSSGGSSGRGRRLPIGCRIEPAAGKKEMYDYNIFVEIRLRSTDSTRVAACAARSRGTARDAARCRGSAPTAPLATCTYLGPALLSHLTFSAVLLLSDVTPCSGNTRRPEIPRKNTGRGKA